MPSTIQPIRMQESCCLFDGITPNLLIARFEYVALTVLATVFSMAWYITVMQRSLVVYHEYSSCHLYFLD